MENVHAFTLTLAFTLVLVTASAPLAGAQDDPACSLDRTNTLLVGLVGVGVEGVSMTTEDIPEACQEEAYTLEGSNPGDDFDVCWHDENGDELDCHATPGDEADVIPDEATEARIFYWSGAAGTYTLTAPAETDNGDDPEAPEDAITDDVTLYLHGEPTGLGQADLILGESNMSQQEPDGDVPSIWYSPWAATGANPNTIWDANWEWSPEEGYNVQNANVDVTFWAASAYDALIAPAWELTLFSDGEEVAHIEEVRGDLAPLGEPIQVTATFSGVTLQGEDLTFMVQPVHVDSSAVHAILFDSTDFPSHLDITVPDGTSGIELDASTTGDTYIQLEWTDVPGIDHYRVHQDDAAIAEPDENTTLVTDLDPDTAYTFDVAAVAMNGDTVLESDEVTITTKTEAQISDPTIEDLRTLEGSTAAQIAWTTNTPTTGEVTVHEQEHTTSLGTEHEVTLTHLTPGSSPLVTVTVEDLSGNTASQTETLDLSETQTFYLHNRGEDHERFMNEFDHESESSGVGWNLLGALVATTNHHTDTTVLEVEDVWPAEAPTNPGVTLEDEANVDATIYMQFPSSTPVGTVHDETVGTITLNLTLYANDDVLGYDVQERVILLDEGWIPINFDIEPNFRDLEPGTLRAELVAENATTAYIIGYEDDHASHIDFPIEATLPLQGTIDAPEETILVEDETTFQANAHGGEGDLTYTWEASTEATIDEDGTTATVTFHERGEHTVTVNIQDEEDNTFTASTSVYAHQKDFDDGARTVVAVIDTGINPYHPIYQRPGINVPVHEFPNVTGEEEHEPRTVQLSDEGTYEQRVNSYRYDRDAWNDIDHEELVYFEDTNVLSISFDDDNANPPILDTGTHGTATTSTVLDNFPDAIIVSVQVSALLSFNTEDHFEHITEGMEWAAQQPWIDVVSVSMGLNGNPPVNSQFHEWSKHAYDQGKMVFVSSGNDPNTNPTGATDGAPWVLSISGSQNDGQGKEVMSTNMYPDFVAQYTVEAASPATTEDDYRRTAGTSFSAPTAAGVAAASIHEVREHAEHHDGIEDGDLVPELNGGITNADVRAALNKTAILPEWDGYVAGLHWNGDHTHPPGAPWLTAQWGHVDTSIIGDTAWALIEDDLDVPEDKEEAAAYKEFTYQLRATYWNNAR